MLSLTALVAYTHVLSCCCSQPAFRGQVHAINLANWDVAEDFDLRPDGVRDDHPQVRRRKGGMRQREQGLRGCPQHGVSAGVTLGPLAWIVGCTSSRKVMYIVMACCLPFLPVLNAVDVLLQPALCTLPHFAAGPAGQPPSSQLPWATRGRCMAHAAWPVFCTAMSRTASVQRLLRDRSLV